MPEEKLDILRGDDVFAAVPKIYFNAVRVTRTYNEFQFSFGQAVFNTLRDEPELALQIHFIGQTSPQHMKILVKILNQQLNDYEKEFGKIPELPSVTQQDTKK